MAHDETRISTGNVAIELQTYIDSWRRQLDYEVEIGEKRPHTVAVYIRSVTQFAVFLTERGMPTDITGITREHVQEFIRDLRRRTKGSTANTRYRALQRFFAWAVEEGEIPESPAKRVIPPRVDTESPQALTEEQVKK